MKKLINNIGKGIKKIVRWAGIIVISLCAAYGIACITCERCDECGIPMHMCDLHGDVWYCYGCGKIIAK